MVPARMDRASPKFLKDGTVFTACAIVLLQAVAAIYFVGDGIDDAMFEARDGIGFEVIMECLIAFALLAGVAFGARYIRRLLTEARRRDEALSVARGAVSELIAQRFRDWQLSAAEAEVGLFAIKGCSVAEIAELRGAASGTVRAQLSRVYSKAGVSSRPMLISLFIDDLLGTGV